MEGQSARNASKSRHQWKLCGHCDELLSYSAYRMHRTLYLTQSEQQWIREAENHDQASDPGCRSSDFDNDGYMEFSNGLSPDENDCSQTGLNIIFIWSVQAGTGWDSSSLLSRGWAPYVCRRRAWYTPIAHVPVCTQNLGTSYIFVVDVNYLTSSFISTRIITRKAPGASAKSSFKWCDRQETAYTQVHAIRHYYPQNIPFMIVHVRRKVW